MKFPMSKLAQVMIPLLSATVVVGCNDSDNNKDAYFDTTNPPKINIVIPDTSGPVAKLKASGKVDEPIKAGDNEAVLYLVEKPVEGAKPNYSDYNLYIWNDDKCGRAKESIVSQAWDKPNNFPTAVDENGPYWRLPLRESRLDCMNIIVRQGANNKITDNIKFDFGQIKDRTGSITAGKSEPFDSREKAFLSLAGIAKAEAHLVDAHTLVWDGAATAKEVRLYLSLASDITPKGKDYQFDNQYIVLSSGAMSADAKKKFPALAGKTAYSIDSKINMRPIIKAELVAMAVDEKGDVIAATKVQPAGSLDNMFAANAQKAELGAMTDGSTTSFRVWSPSAQNIVAVLFNKDKKEFGRLQMRYSEASGVWSVNTDKAPAGTYYRYLVNVVHPVSSKVESYQVTDPYALSLSRNSEYSQVVDLNDPALKPDGWDSLKAPNAQDNPAKFVIYESHVRDFSALDQTVPEQDRGKFTAFTDSDSEPVKHLKALSDSGVTHLHLLPFFDIATINEDPTKVANINDPFSELCAVNKAVTTSRFSNYCVSGLTIAEVLDIERDNDTPTNPVVQELNRYVSATDSFNWGYDPFHYTVPEGSYSTNAEGTQRILETREMIKAVKENIGMNVVMDVVYNHTNAAGPTERTSVLDKIVPWYYNRLDPVTGNVMNSTCCSNTAPEHAMMAKLIKDSLVVWARDYKVDSFRFDLMGHHPLAQIKESLAAVKQVDPNTYFYGEGWNFGEVENDKLFVQATQPHLGGTGIGSFSDRLRDAVRGGGPFDDAGALRTNKGFGNGINDQTEADVVKNALHLADLTRLGMAGNLKTFSFVDSTGTKVMGKDVDYNGQAAGYADDPTEIQNYVSKHDNQTLWDNNQYKAPDATSLDTRVRMQAVSLATAMLGQGVPFTHMGSDLLRSKSMQRDSYDSGDWYNHVDFSYQDNNWNKGLPRKDKDGKNYPTIDEVLNQSGLNAQPAAEEIQQMAAYFQELASLRKAYPLLTLGKGSEVNRRVAFHNTGPKQQQGLIVMSVDNGAGAGIDLDPKKDAVVVAINASSQEKTFTLKDVKGLRVSSFHRTDLAKGAKVSGDTLTIPAWTPVVFVLPRGEQRGTGIPVKA
ncbi:type II secretion protein [Photobacterium jeanii]|uniref:Type II secretion protein n=1 Tax=Photobacterium jeanii TaxID=858640 RepID=A0A178K9H3_9GAMM|nr:pullulanase-type alpha-1,6-glucosidase [Photobacterium jeanii]OAN13303.1 type II secretion protein [Photobacterium jeanii]PST90302.1 pullulanase-type alpha-1,6-glucosidase [Photobacterium jeanii]